MARKVIESKIVNNAYELQQVLQRFIATARTEGFNAEEINIEESISLIETKLTDGSVVYDIHLGSWLRSI